MLGIVKYIDKYSILRKFWIEIYNILFERYKRKVIRCRCVIFSCILGKVVVYYFGVEKIVSGMFWSYSVLVIFYEIVIISKFNCLFLNYIVFILFFYKVLCFL